VLGAILLLVFALADVPDGSGDGSAGATSAKAQCEETFGVGASVCANESTVPSTPAPDAFASSDDDDTPGVTDVAKLALGVIPAALVGALTAVINIGGRS
jgi:hypothetical protein